MNWENWRQKWDACVLAGHRATGKARRGVFFSYGVDIQQRRSMV